MMHGHFAVSGAALAVGGEHSWAGSGHIVLPGTKVIMG